MGRVRSIVTVLSAPFRTEGDVLKTLEFVLETNRLLMRRLEGPVRFTPDERRRLALLAHGIRRKLLETYSVLATPDTLLRWYRTLVAEKYSAPPRRPGRPPIELGIRNQIVRLARENPPRGIVRYLVCFVVDVGSREVRLAGIGREPDSAWMEQLARNLTDAEDGFLTGKRHLVMDRVVRGSAVC